MKKQIAMTVGGILVALSIGLVGCTTPRQNPQNVLNLSEPAYSGNSNTLHNYWPSYATAHKLRTVHFAWNSAVINPVWNNELDNLATGLKAHPRAVVTLVGFTDSTGGPGYNQKLGMKRAMNVARYLCAQGVPMSQIRVMSAGQRHPIANNADAVGQHQNRRVDVIVSAR